MADNTYTQGVYRERGGNRFVVASSGSADVESGGEIDIEAGGQFKVSGTAFITTGAKIDLSSARSWISTGIYSTGTVTADAFTSTGGTVGSGKFNSVTSTGTGTFNAVTSTGTGTFNAVTSTGTGTFNAVTSTGTGTFNAVTSTGIITGDSFTSTGGTVGSGKFNSVTSTGTGTFNAVTSTGTGTFNAVSSTGAGTFDSITTTGGTAGTIKGQQVTANLGYVTYIETLTTASTQITGYGISHVTVTTSGHLFALAAPVTGIDKWISVVTTTTLTISSSEAGADIAGSTQISITTGTLTAPAWIHLAGRNSTSWTALAMSANVSIS